MSNRSCCIVFLALAALAFVVLPAQAQRGFGQTLLVQQGELFVGEPDNLYRSGAVHVYRKDGQAWTKQTELTAPNAEMNDHFGKSIAIDGDRLIVGATGREGEPGSAYIFERDGQGWTHQATLTPSEIMSDDRYGVSVGLAGEFAFVGAPAGDEASGATYVFERNAEGAWNEVARFEATGASEGAGFGTAIASNGERAYIGAPGLNDEAGGVYVYELDAGTWTETRLLEGRITGEGDRYGAALDASGSELIVGVPRFADRVGAAIVYRYDPEAGEWSGSALLLPYAAENAPAFGSDVAIGAGDAWIGAPTGDLLHGSAYRFARTDEGAFRLSEMMSTEDLERGDLYGRSLDADGTVAAVGIEGDDYGAGSVAIFERNGDGTWTNTTVLQSESVGLQPITGNTVSCENGSAERFTCEQVDLLSFLPIGSLGGDRGVKLNDIWGWTDPETDREYALVGRVDGTAFVDVSNPHTPLYLGSLPKTEGSPGSAWRDIKVYENHAYIVADNAGEHGMQIFDLTQLRDFEGEPQIFEPTALYTNINSAHNIVINTETGYAYAVGNSGGGETCGGGLHMIDIQDPANPTFAGCYAAEGTGRAGTGYTHDAQCLVYEGPDADYTGRELCFGSNETALNIADVTDKENPVSVATASYPNVAYTHQGWISEDHRYFYVNDELDEVNGNVEETRTLIWDVTDIDDPQLVKQYTWGTQSTDHNLYIRGNLMYQSNYVTGLRIHDISDPENPREVGYFDTMPVGDNKPGFAGSWSNYPYFDSGTIVVSSIGEGLFVLRKKEEVGL